MGQIWLDQVHCAGNESNLDQCLHWHWGEHNCGHTEDVGIRCSQASRKAVNVDSEEFHPTVIQTERSGRILPTECGIVKVNQNVREPDFHFKVVRGTKATKGFHPWQVNHCIKYQL
jgi:HGF/MSP/plasminogen-like protein